MKTFIIEFDDPECYNTETLEVTCENITYRKEEHKYVNSDKVFYTYYDIYCDHVKLGGLCVRDIREKMIK